MVACCALVVRPYSRFIAAITLERDLGVVVFELVFRVAEMRNFIVFHDGYV